MMTKKKARLGFIGAGWWATANYIPLLAARDDVELVAVCRLGVAELRRAKDHFGFPFATEDAAELVRLPNLDGVIVTSPHTLHHAHARLALERGLHVMCDKPMCTRGEDARDLVRLAREKGVHLLVPYGWHYKPFVQTAKRWLDAGASARCRASCATWRLPSATCSRASGSRSDEGNSGSSARYTVPMPPAQSRPNARYRPTTSGIG